MAKSKKDLPPSRSLDELMEFFDTHDLGEYWERMPEAHFDIDIKRRTQLVAIDGELIDRLSKVAKSKHASVETLINSWLREKIVEAD